MTTRISKLLKEHRMTLKDGAMVCKAGDWPEDKTPMPETEDVLSRERMEYSIQRVLGHEEHLAQIVDQAQADAWDDGWDVSRQHPEPACPDDYNPLRSDEA